MKDGDGCHLLRSVFSPAHVGWIAWLLENFSATAASVEVTEYADYAK